MDLVMGEFAATTPMVEIDADVTAAQILNRAGFSAQALIDVLAKLHFITGDAPCHKDVIEGKSNYRNYPNFCQRRDAILEVMKF